MARPIKEGLEYCSLDTNIFSDRKIRRLLKTFGAKGYTIFSCLLCEIYKDKGYYMQYDDELAFDISDNIPGTTEQLVKDVINFCFECDLFNKAIFTAMGTLTSAGIQKRYRKAKEGSKIVIVQEIWINDQETGVINEETPVKAPISTQSKVNESKVNESKVNIPAQNTNSVPTKFKYPPPVAPPPSNGPPIEDVIRFFRGAGGNEEMARKFWNAKEAVGWMNRGSPIVKWAPLANNFIANFHETDKHGNSQGRSTISGSINAVTAAFSDIQRDLDEAMRSGGEDL